jgi:putative hydrolase of the HAD superfamily
LTIAAVLFDLDDTLHDRAGSLRAFVRDQHRRWFSDRIAQDRFVDRFIALDANGHRPKAELYPRLLDDLGLGQADPQVLLAEYAERYHAFAQPRDGAQTVLAALRAQGHAIGIVSNGWTTFQSRTVHASGLAGLVDLVLISEQEGLRKPDPRLFARAAARLSTPAAHCLFVGDNPVADIAGARDAGMRTAWIPGGFAWPDALPRADRDLASLYDLIPPARTSAFRSCGNAPKDHR